MLALVAFCFHALMSSYLMGIAKFSLANVASLKPLLLLQRSGLGTFAVALSFCRFRRLLVGESQFKKVECAVHFLHN